MRKLFRLMILLAVLVVAAVVGVTLFLDQGIKRAVEVVGARLLQVEVRLDQVSLSLISGRVELAGLAIGNPTGYQSESAIELGRLVLEAQPGSLMSDKVVIRSLNLQAPVITFEGGLKENNLRRILDNLNATIEDLRTPDRRKTPDDDKAKRKLQVDEIVLAGGKVQVWMKVLGGRPTTIDLPEIRLTNLGAGPEGITTAELLDRLLRVIIEKATIAAAGALAGPSAGGADTVGRAGQEALDEATGNVTDWLKRQQ